MNIREHMHRIDCDIWWNSFRQFWAIVGIGSMLQRALVIVATDEEGQREQAATLVANTLLGSIQAVSK